MTPESLIETVTLMGSRVEATEAIALRVTPAFAQPLIDPLVHVRPDSSDAATRAQAVAAFAALVEPCVERGKDGFMEVAPAASGTLAQFCLIRLVRRGDEVVGATAFISRCSSEDQARDRLNDLCNLAV